MISVIIPTLNEEHSLPPLLDAISRQEVDYEVIVVDGGSQDRTLAIARHYGARIFVSAPGRGSGIRLGVEQSRGGVLYFLHADSTLLPGALHRIDEVLSTSDAIIGGNFRVVFGGGKPGSRLLTRFYFWVWWVGVCYCVLGVVVRCSV